MGNLARDYQQHQQQQTTQQKQAQTTVRTVGKFSKVTLGEKLLGAVLIAFVCFIAVKIISAQAAIYEVNKDIQDVQKTVQEQKKINDDLDVQVKELSRHDRIWNKAKSLGLNLNENNVKVVEKK